MKQTLFILAFLFTSFVAIAQTDSTKTTCACCAEEYRQFDFWLGSWVAYEGEDLSGSNQIVLLQDSCIIQENWVSKGGKFSGTSYNYYDAQTKKWNQLWIDNQGRNLKLSGSLENGSMVLSSALMTNKKGEKYTNRITWTPKKNGTVQQHWEIKKENSPDWWTVFNGIYKKVNR